MSIESNPIFKKNANFDGALAFDKIQPNHFLPAIEDSIKLSVDDQVDHILKSTDAFLSGMPCNDDRTIVILEIE